MAIVTRFDPDLTGFPVLLFDGDCAFCTAAAKWTDRWVRPDAAMVAWQFVDLEALAVTEAQCQTSIQWLTAPDDAVHEAAAAAAVLRSGRPPWPLIGRAMTARGVIQAANAVYRFIARHRHRLPGSTPACMTVPPPRAHDAA